MLSTINKKTPIPIAGLMLALASIGNLVARHSMLCKNILGLLSTIIFALLSAKIIAYPRLVLGELHSPIALSVAPTYSMGLMILATYLRPYADQFALVVWLLAIIMHILLMISFIKRHILNFNINKVFASYFIVFVGIVVASVTAPVFNMNLLGQYILYFGITSYLLILPVVLYRVYIIKNIADPAKPTTAILAAPASLCLAGYLSSFAVKNITLFYALLFLSICFTIIILINTPKLLKAQFYASYSALTFPFAITAIAMRKATLFAAQANLGLNWLNFIAQFTEVWAIFIIAYVFIRYCGYYYSLTQKADINY